MPPPSAPTAARTAHGIRVHRIEVRASERAGDPRAARLEREAADLGYPTLRASVVRVYLIEAALDTEAIERLAASLLADSVAEIAHIGASEPRAGVRVIEVHPLPGVMDPAAQTVADAIMDLSETEAEVVTGWRYELEGVSAEQARAIAERLVANAVIHGIHDDAYWPEALPKGSPAEIKVASVPIRELDDPALQKLSREGHLFLDLHEMHAIQEHYRVLSREPTEIELETLAQTWSEHCVHKTLKSTIRYQPSPEAAEDAGPIDWTNRPGHVMNDDGSVTINNLLKSTVAAATFELMDDGIDWCLSVFHDNSGVIALDDTNAVCIKVETHNHPSAIEPYGGAATGIGGCIRDIIGTGLAAKPIASTDVFCVGTPTIASVPEGCIHPSRVLSEVVAGVRDYGNRMGIPTVNGAVWFDDRHVGNPLVFCGCVGILPRDCIDGEAQPGDLIVALGGRTGRDGIHGATFSSAELSDSHSVEFGHAVQIGNAIEEKRTLDTILRARDEHGSPLFSAITDCGAGGFSSAVGEMGEKLGATVQLDQAPLKYQGLTPTETWISEAQERMVLAVPSSKLAMLQAICDEEHCELSVLGTFGTPSAELVLRHGEVEVGRLSMDFMHNGVPQPTREASWHDTPRVLCPEQPSSAAPATEQALLALLAHPIIASKHRIVRQYDHEVQGNTIIRPLVGPGGIGPGDAAVIEPVPGSGRGIALGCGLATGLERDPYLMALAAIDEAVRNVVCVGADPSRIAILDNFCWPSCSKPENLGSLVRAAEGCYDGAKAYRTPFVSGKDSLNNQFTPAGGETIEIPPTLLITSLGIVPNLARVVTSDAKRSGHVVLLVGETKAAGGGSMYERVFGIQTARAVLMQVAGSLTDQATGKMDDLLDSIPEQTRADLERLIEHASERVPADRLESLRDKAWTKLRSMVGNDAWSRLEQRLGSDRLHDVAAKVVETVGRRASIHSGLPRTDLVIGPKTARAVSEQIAAGRVRSAHDCSEGGMLVALAEMLIASGGGTNAPIGCELADGLGGLGPAAFAFAETPSRYLLEVPALNIKEVERAFEKADVPCRQIGVLNHTGTLRCDKLSLDVSVESLAAAWRGEA